MKQKTKLASKRIIAIIGFLIGGFWLIGFFSTLGDSQCIFWLFLALVFILPSIWRMRNVSKWEKLLFLIGSKNEVSIDSLAQETSSTYEKLVKELPILMRKSGLNGYVDIENRKFIRNDINKSNTDYKRAYTDKPQPQNCPSCGAPCSAEAVEKGKCEYCGAVLTRESYESTYKNEKASEKNVSEHLNNHSRSAGELTVYGYNEWYAVANDVIVFKNGIEIGRIPQSTVFKIDISEDCVIKFKLGIRNCVYHAKKNKKESIQLITNRWSGKFSYKIM